MPLKPVQALEDYMAATAEEEVEAEDPNKDQEILVSQRNIEMTCGVYDTDLW